MAMPTNKRHYEQIDVAQKQDSVIDFEERHQQLLRDVAAITESQITHLGISNLVPHSFSLNMVAQLHYPIDNNVYVFFFSDVDMPRVTINLGKTLNNRWTTHVFNRARYEDPNEIFIDFCNVDLNSDGAIRTIVDGIISNLLMKASIATFKSTGVLSTKPKASLVKSFDIESGELIVNNSGSLSALFTVKTIGSTLVMQVKQLHDFAFVESLVAGLCYLHENFSAHVKLSFNECLHPEIYTLNELTLTHEDKQYHVSRSGNLFKFTNK